MDDTIETRAAEVLEAAVRWEAGDGTEADDIELGEKVFLYRQARGDFATPAPADPLGLTNGSRIRAEVRAHLEAQLRAHGVELPEESRAGVLAALTNCVTPYVLERDEARDELEAVEPQRSRFEAFARELRSGRHATADDAARAVGGTGRPEARR